MPIGPLPKDPIPSVDACGPQGRKPRPSRTPPGSPARPPAGR
jgi:hypothetical protein